jgi:transglutaminase-like putative cysteine protease
VSALDRASLPGGIRGPADGLRSPARLGPVATARQRPGVRLATFAALGLYGTLRWDRLTSPGPGLRLTGMVLFAVAIAALGVAAPALGERAWHGGWHRVAWMFRGWGRRTLSLALGLVSLGVVFALAGIPVSWLLHLRVAVVTSGVGQGLSALPGVLLPYLGINPWVHIVMNLGAGLLLLGAALTICTRSPSEVRRIAAALQLAAIAVIPSTVMHPALPYVDGLLLFVLVAAFLWGERVVSGRSGAALAVLGVAAVASTAIAPALAHHRPWFNYRSLTASLSPRHIDTFNWTQSYGPYNWPRDDRTVMSVKARRADYWKAENLDVFNGIAWAQGGGPVSAAAPSPSPRALRRWSQTITVTVEAMRTTQVIAAGVAGRPAHIDAPLVPGKSPGTWSTTSALAPGSTYAVTTYSPRPSPAELRAIPASAYPDAALSDYRVVGLPAPRRSRYPAPEVAFAPFHSGQPAYNMTSPFGPVGVRLVEQSPYARAYQLARSLAQASPTPYAFVTEVQRYLAPANGFVYDEHVSRRAYPLEAFLFATKRGYCQQFAGAMALLLRMGGLPARVATGFTSGIFDSADHQYLVSDRDAHAWVEVWFPHYGWVRFDPTPPSAPAIASTSGGVSSFGQQTHTIHHVTARRNAATGGRTFAHRARTASGSPAIVAIVLPALALLLVGGLGAQWLRGGSLSAEQLVAELERALARSGRPAAAGLTLHALERRFGSSPAAARYVRRLRLARYGERDEPPTRGERRALRAQLATGLGLLGWIRAWWALPPRRPARRGA